MAWPIISRMASWVLAAPCLPLPRAPDTRSNVLNWRLDGEGLANALPVNAAHELTRGAGAVTVLILVFCSLTAE